MDKIEIDEERAIDLVRKAVAARGEHYTYSYENGASAKSYSPCAYWHVIGNEPGCIVGYALHLAGVSSDVLQSLDVPLKDNISTSIVFAHIDLTRNNVILTHGAIKFFRFVQGAQDRMCTWGDSLAYGLRVRKDDYVDVG